MKRYGRQKQHPGNLEDNHPSKGFINWWEAEYHCGKSKKRERYSAKRCIVKEIEEYGNTSIKHGIDSSINCSL
jgi:hypothetical protein